MKVGSDKALNIEQWLDELKRAWEQHDVDSAVALFSDDVEYWESPHHLVSPGDVAELWKDVYSCIDTKVNCEVYAREGEKYAVIWSAIWKNDSGELQEKAGTYLVTLDENGKCNYFYRTSMAKEVET